MEKKAGLKNVLKNSLYLFSGNSVAAVFGLLSSLILARYFGPEKFGIIALFQVCIVMIRGFFSMQTWQAIIKYGVDTLKTNRNSQFFSVTKITLFIEIITLLISGATAIFLVVFLNNLWGLPGEYVSLAVLFCLTIFLNFSDYFTGILRLFNKFHLFSIYLSASSLVRFIFIVIIWTQKLSFISSVQLLVVFEFLKNIALILLGILVFNRKVETNFFKSLTIKTDHRFSFRDIFSFLGSIWLWSTLRMLPREFDIFLLGGLLGPSSVGLYKIAKQFGTLVSRIYTPIYQAVFPDINIMKQKRHYQKIKKLLSKLTALILLSSFIIFLIFLFFGKSILLLTVGEKYILAYLPAVFYLIALLIFSGSIAFIPFLFSIQNEKYVIKVYLVAALSYFLILPFLVIQYGILGASLAYAIFNLGVAVFITTKSFSILNMQTFEVKENHEKYTI